MRSKREFIKDGLILTATSLLLRTVGVFFSSRLAVLAGAVVMGLHSQIMSVYGFAVTAAAAGVSLGTMRLTAECVGSNNTRDIRQAMRQGFLHCGKTSLLMALILFFSAPFLGGILLADNRTVMALRILAVALPFISFGAALHGYFQGVKQIYKSAFVNIFEQFCRIGLTLYALGLVDRSDSGKVCLVLVGCNALAEVISFIILYTLYKFDSKKYNNYTANFELLRLKFRRITLPIATSALLRSALTTAEHILIPIGLKKYSGDSESALAQYGILCSMALPIVLYPMALLSAFTSVTTAEICTRVSGGEREEKIRSTVSLCIGYTFIYGIGCAVVIRYFSFSLGYGLFGSIEAAEYIKLLAPLIILMYIDHIADGILKGLDAQKFVMKINIIDAFLSVILAVVLVPKFGVLGFIIILYVCEFFNCTLSVGKLLSLCNFKVHLMRHILLPCAAAIVSVWFFKLIAVALSRFGVMLLSYNTAAGIVVFSVIFLLILWLCGCIFSKEKAKLHI